MIPSSRGANLLRSGDASERGRGIRLEDLGRCPSDPTRQEIRQVLAGAKTGHLTRQIDRSMPWETRRNLEVLPGI